MRLQWATSATVLTAAVIRIFKTSDNYRIGNILFNGLGKVNRFLINSTCYNLLWRFSLSETGNRFYKYILSLLHSLIVSS